MASFELSSFTIINLAAARFDFGATAEDYFHANVSCHADFLDTLSGFRVERFIHISSVAALDGRHIPYSEMLGCDDAYRATKFMQESLIRKWCDERRISLTVLYPSAIFSDDPRSDTNIGKLQTVSSYLPFIPAINVIKSVTYLPNLSKFICDVMSGEIKSGRYLTIDRPSLTVSEMMTQSLGAHCDLFIFRSCRLLIMVALLLHVFGFFGRVDVDTPNEDGQLFSDTCLMMSLMML